MLDNLADKHAILNKSPDLLRQRTLLSVILITLGRQDDIHACTLAGKDLSVETLLAKIDGSAVHLIQQNGGESSLNLQGKVGALDDVDGGDKAVNDEVRTRAVVNTDCVGLALEDDGSLVAARDKDRLAERDLDFDGSGVVVKVFLSDKVSICFLPSSKFSIR